MANEHILQSLYEFSRSGQGDLADFYPESASRGLKFYKGEKYPGKKVIWRGDSGPMFRVKSDYVEPFWGNIFDANQLRAVIDGIKYSEDKVPFSAAPATVTQIDLQAVQESLEYRDEQKLKLSTGDDDLDRYLLNPNEYIYENFGLKPGDVEDPDIDYRYGSGNYDDVKQEWDNSLAEAEKDGRGDLGEWMASLRDGNHRAFGAILAGEPFIWVYISAVQMAQMDQYGKYDALRKLLK
jgi:hypothetical protein